MRRTLLSLVGVLIAGVSAVAQDPAGPAPEPMGSLAIRAIQGTAGAATPSAGRVEIHLFHQNQPVRMIEATLDEVGMAVVGEIPISLPVRPLVRIEHAGVIYQEAGPQLDVSSPSAAMEVTVYEVSEAEPAWRVASRQVIVTPGPGGVRVVESVFVDNPNDKTWLGGETAGSDKRTTVRLGLPASAGNVQLVHGFHGWCCTAFEEGTLAVQMPLMPGRAAYEFSYEVPAAVGEAAIAVSSPAPTDELALIVPESGLTAKAEGLTAGSVQMSEQGPMRLYLARGVAGGASPRLTLAGLAAPAAQRSLDPDVLPRPGGGSGISTGWIVGGAIAGLGLGVVLVAMRRTG